MKCSRSISTILFIHGAIVSIVVKCGQLPCHSCDAWLTNQTNPTPRCHRTTIECDDQKHFCGIAAIRSNTSALAYRYREMCIDHVLCTDTTAACPQPGCYLYCCHEDLCNKYDDVSEIINISYHLAAVLTPVTKQPEVIKNINTRQTTHSTASLLTSSKIVLLSLSFMIFKYCI